MANVNNSLELTLDAIKQLESILLGLKQMRGYVGDGIGQEMLEVLIEEGQAHLATIKRKLIQ